MTAAFTDPTRMPAVLHIIDPLWAGLDSLLGLHAFVSLLPEQPQHAILVGPAECEQHARALGVTITDRVNMPLGRVSLCGPALERLIRLRAEQLHGFSSVFVWSPRLAPMVARMIARLVSPDVPVTMMLTVGPRASDAGRKLWLHTGTGAARLRSACFDDQIADAWAHYGLMRPEVLPVPATLNIDWEAQRLAVRRELELRDDELALALLCDPATEGDARLFTWINGVLTIAGKRVVGILPAAAGQMRRAARYLRMHHREWEVVRYKGPMPLALPAADLVIWDLDPRRLNDDMPQPSGGQLAARLAASTGVPMVAVACGLSRRTLVGAPGWCLIGAATMPGLGSGCLPLADDSELRREVGKMLRDGCDQQAQNQSFTEAARKLTAPRSRELAEVF